MGVWLASRHQVRLISNRLHVEDLCSDGHGVLPHSAVSPSDLPRFGTGMKSSQWKEIRDELVTRLE